jgi:hypothetical protein
MSARTAAQHTADELRYHGLRGDYAVWSAPSASKPGKHNVIVRDIATGEHHCDCVGAECGRRCWHANWLETAWIMTQVAPFVASRSDDELLTIGQAAKARLDDRSATVTDLAVYYQARVEWRERAAQAAPALVLQFPTHDHFAVAA